MVSRRVASSAESGSSSSSSFGCTIRARASETRCSWPPDSSVAFFLPMPASPTSSSIFSVARASSSLPIVRFTRGTKLTFCSTVMRGKSSAFWKTMATGRFSGAMPAMDSPSMQISPASASSRPATIFSSVDLPQPDSPSSTQICPRSRPSSKPSTQGASICG